MFQHTKAVRLALSGMAFALALTACSDNGSDPDVDGTGGEALSGTVRADGSSTVGPLTEVAAELFTNEHSGVAIDVAISGTGGGFQKFCIGENDISNASRPIKQEEIDLCAENNIAYEGVQVANDALSIVVNQSNPVVCITVEQASSIWSADATASTWGDVEGFDLPAEMAGEAINLFGPGSDSGTFDYFTDAINGEEGNIISTYTDIGEDDKAAVDGVVGDPYAMAYIPYSYLQEALDQVKPLQIDGGNGCVEATLENVLDGSYAPLGRPLFVYASDVALAKPEVLAFMEFFIESQVTITETAGFIPMNDEQAAASLAQVQALAS